MRARISLSNLGTGIGEALRRYGEEMRRNLLGLPSGEGEDEAGRKPIILPRIGRVAFHTIQLTPNGPVHTRGVISDHPADVADTLRYMTDVENRLRLRRSPWEGLTLEPTGGYSPDRRDRVREWRTREAVRRNSIDL
jgi:hypothetical protein